MATTTTYPSVPTPGGLTKAVNQFRTATFPAVLDVATLKRLQIAPTNESYVINTFKALGLIDDDGKRNEEGMAFFFADEAGFRSGLDVLGCQVGDVSRLMGGCPPRALWRRCVL